MKKHLYFQSDNFDSNLQLAKWLSDELRARGVEVQDFIEEDFMVVLVTRIKSLPVNFYMGKNDEPTDPFTWQVWPEMNMGLIAKLFKKKNAASLAHAKEILAEIINGAQGVSNVEWDNI